MKRFYKQTWAEQEIISKRKERVISGKIPFLSPLFPSLPCLPFSPLLFHKAGSYQADYLCFFGGHRAHRTGYLIGSDQKIPD